MNTRRFPSVQMGWQVGTGLLVLTIGAALAVLAPRGWWLTPDQQAQQMFERGEFAAAAERYTDPRHRGAALYRAGRFEAAAAAFARDTSARGHFNRGNALTMRGNYLEAIGAYERALALQPGWPEAADNLAIARLRAERTRLEGGDMTGGMMEADDIVFDTQQRDTDEGGKEQTEGGQALSDAELQALWLRRVQTRPADFLRAKFAFQLAAQQSREVQP